MARPVFTQQLRRFTTTPELETPTATLQAALDASCSGQKPDRPP